MTFDRDQPGQDGRRRVLMSVAFGVAGLVIGGLVYDSGPGIGAPQVIGLVVGAVVGVAVARWLERRTGKEG